MLQRRPVAGRDYSGSYVDLLRRFSNDIACLCWLRWSEGLHLRGSQKTKPPVM